MNTRNVDRPISAMVRTDERFMTSSLANKKGIAFSKGATELTVAVVIRKI
ncbi:MULTISPECIES: hypothetical protein [unclassified Shewanella]|nr:hypothetical protein [Shewanella sp. ALD9]